MSIIEVSEYLPGWKVLSISSEQSGHAIEAQYQKTPEICPKCSATPPRLYRHGLTPANYWDRPHWGGPIRLKAYLQRYRCRDCNCTFVSESPDIEENRRMTKRCVKYIIEHSLICTPDQISRRIGCEVTTIRRVIDPHFKDCINAPVQPSTDIPKSTFLPRHTPHNLVTETDVALWLIAVPRIHPRNSTRREHYVRAWNVHEKILAAKQRGEWEAIRLKGLALAADHELLGYL
jgi:transposase-like protein